ncbi:MAG TPA: peptidylprolyl isomerase [Ktedonosporobacter sp.]|jgi:peptidylprolyl isomerase|nr:peptidylprolyl isomerase [Ktedonosporobacter sp.]
MPKTTKRTETKRAAKIARAHMTELSQLEVKDPKQRRPAPGYKRPARGIARYPLATTIILALLVLGTYVLYSNHLWPFTLPPKQPKAAAVSPCLNTKILGEITNVSPGPSAADIAKITHTYKTAPAMSIDTKKVYCAGINTNRGLIVVELDPQLAPQTVNNFVFLAQHNFYNGLVFHRVIQTGTGLHIIQTGDPLGSDPAKRGTGGPGYKFNDEPVKGDYTAGTIAMANSGPNTNGSQFFIDTGNNTSLPKSYNLFGHVVKGLDIASKIQGPGDDASTKNIKPDVINYLIVVPAS